MSAAWPQMLPPWVTAQLALRDWRARLVRVEAQEAAHFAGLPYVRAVAVIGSVGRGTQWPLSDLDLFIVADPWEGNDPEDLVRGEEEARNRQLDAQGIPNDLEASDWVLTTEDVQAALSADEAGFLRILEHPHWRGLVMKSAGARTAYDPHGLVAPLLARCESILWSDTFLSLWRHADLREQRENLHVAASCLARGAWRTASRTLLRNDGAIGWYAAWRRLPESITRGATRFLRTAQEMCEPEIAGLFLTANRLREEEVWARFAAAPSEGQRERDVWLAVRQSVEEGLTGLEATRDLLHVSQISALWSDDPEHWPAWAGATDDEAGVRAQYAAAAEMLARLEVKP